MKTINQIGVALNCIFQSSAVAVSTLTTDFPNAIEASVTIS